MHCIAFANSIHYWELLTLADANVTRNSKLDVFIRGRIRFGSGRLTGAKIKIIVGKVLAQADIQNME